jgi:hypothetical protein
MFPIFNESKPIVRHGKVFKTYFSLEIKQLVNIYDKIVLKIGI